MQGTVNRVNYNGKAYSAEVSGSWYGAGFNEPSFKEGDVIEFEVEQRGRFQNLKSPKVVGSSEGSSAPQKAAPQGIDARTVSIAYQSSRKDAIEFVDVLVKNGAVSLPTKKSEQADALLALVEDYTAQFYIKLEEVIQDGGVTLEDMVPGTE